MCATVRDCVQLARRWGVNEYGLIGREQFTKHILLLKSTGEAAVEGSIADVRQFVDDLFDSLPIKTDHHAGGSTSAAAGAGGAGGAAGAGVAAGDPISGECACSDGAADHEPAVGDEQNSADAPTTSVTEEPQLSIDTMLSEAFIGRDTIAHKSAEEGVRKRITVEEAKLRGLQVAYAEDVVRRQFALQVDSDEVGARQQQRADAKKANSVLEKIKERMQRKQSSTSLAMSLARKFLMKRQVAQPQKYNWLPRYLLRKSTGQQPQHQKQQQQQHKSQEQQQQSQHVAARWPVVAI